MMKKRSLVALGLVSALAMPGVANYLELKITGFPGGSLWQKERRVIVETETRLTEATRIEADELVIAAPIITEGMRLHIDVRKLVFESGGKIIAFDKPAPNNPNSGNSGEPGSPGADYDKEEYDGEEKDGGQGGAGKAGKIGPDGYPGMQDPGEILVFAAKVVGNPVIDGTGQRGGKGGKGGTGGEGGRGGAGSKADADLIGSNERAGKGGPGGPGGPGGQGGNGGQGGRAVRITFLAGHLPEGTRLTGLVSIPGVGGPNGDVGERGAWGKPGRGGDEDCSVFCLSDEDAGGTNSGHVGPLPPELPLNPYKAPQGDDSHPGLLSEKIQCVANMKPHECEVTRNVSTMSLNGLESNRFDVFKAWYVFHWERALNLLIRDSIRIAAHSAWTREQVNQALDGPMQSPEMQALMELNAQSTGRVVEAWTEHFKRPLSEATRDTLLSNRREYMLSVADAAISVLNGDGNIAQLKGSLRELNLTMRQSVREAMQSCLKYNASKVDLLSNFFGATNHYTIPVCSGQPDFSKKQNAAATIVLSLPHKQEETIKGLSPAPKTAALDLIRLFSLIPSAYAETFQVVYLPDSAITLEQVMVGEPKNRPGVDKDGILVGYDVPKQERVTIESLPKFLRSLAIQLGAEG